MTSALQVFSYEDSQIRTYTDKNGEVWLGEGRVRFFRTSESQGRYCKS